MLWAIAAALTGVVVIAILAPFLRPVPRGPVEGAPLPAAAYDLKVYRSQLREVDRDLARGVITADEAGRLRTEIGRKVLEADRLLQRATAAAPAVRGWRAPVIAAVLVAIGIGAFALYQRLGAPDVPDEPIAARAAAAEAVYAARPSQAEAEARAAEAAKLNPPLRRVPDAGYLALIQQLRETVAKRPDDLQGLARLAEHEGRLGNAVAAEAAMRRLVTLKGQNATAADHAQLAGLMVEAAGGIITPEAEEELARALKLDPRQPQARYMQGLLMIQNQRPDRAFPIWRALLEAGPPDAPWIAPIRRVIGDLAWFAGEPNYQPPAEGAMPGPDAAAVSAAAGMSDADREQMIAGMVQQLESRLASQGGTPEEWARLIGALHVQGNDAHAAEILAEARSRFAASVEASAMIEDAASRAGLK